MLYLTHLNLKFSLTIIFGLMIASLLITSLSGLPVQAASNLYVSPGGDDTNPGSLNAPFKTIQKCADVAGNGDICLIRGGTYRETVVPANSSVTFQNYNNEKVVVSGTEEIANNSFNQYAGNIYKANLGWSLNVRHAYEQSTNNQVFVDGKMMVDARWPNISMDTVTSITNIAGIRQDNARADSAQITSSSVASYLDTDLTGAGSYWGAGTNKGKISFNPGYGIMTTSCDITDKNNSQVGFQCGQDIGQGSVSKTFDGVPNQQHSPKGNNYYYLWGKLEALDSPGEFFVDPPTNNTGNLISQKGNYRYDGSFNLYVQLPDSSNPNNFWHTVEVRKRMYGFDLSGRNNININGLTLFAATIKTDQNSNNNKLQNLDMQYLWHTEEAPPLFYEDGTVGLALRGSNNTIQDSNIAYSSGTLISMNPSYQHQNAGNKLINNVIRDSSYSGFGTSVVGNSSDSNNKHQIIQNTIFNSGRFLVQAGSALDIKYNDIFNSNLQISDLGAIYGWGTDGKGSDIGYNYVHDSWAENNAADSQFGSHGIYLDDETTDFNIYRNIVWGINGEGLMLAGYRSTSQAYNPGKTNTNRKVYNNTVDGVFGLLNKCESNQCGFQTGTEIKNNVFSGQLHPPTLESRYGTIDLATNIYGNPLFKNSSLHNYNLAIHSPAIDVGTPLTQSTAISVGSPDIGALENGQTEFTAGAILRGQDLGDFSLNCGRKDVSGSCQIYNLPLGRKVPVNFKIQIGSLAFSGECLNFSDYKVLQTTAECKNITLGSLTNLQPVKVELNSGSSIYRGNDNFDGFSISDVYPISGSTQGGKTIDISGHNFSTQIDIPYSRDIILQNLLNQNLYNYQVPVTMDTSSLIAAGKMRNDCGDVRFKDTDYNLNYWLESDCNTPTTKFWVRTGFIASQGTSKIKLFYGNQSFSSESNGRKTFDLFEDFSGILNKAIVFEAQPAANISIGVQNGEMKISGTTNSSNQNNPWGFRLEKSNLDLPANFAIDSQMEVKQGVSFLASLGGSDNSLSLFASSSGTPAVKDISYYSPTTGWTKVGTSTVQDLATMPKTDFSFGIFGDPQSRTIQWREKDNTRNMLATRSGLNNPDFGNFTFRPGQIGNFDSRFDNLRIRQLTQNGVEPQISMGNEQNEPVFQVKIGGQVCTNLVVVSQSHLTCTIPSHNAGQNVVQLFNQEGQTTISARTYNYQTTN